jgi:hypothetical protein
MMQHAALIVGIGGVMIVMATTSVNVVVMCVIGDPGSCEIIVRDILLSCHNVLEMKPDQRHDAAELGDQKQPQ